MSIVLVGSTSGSVTLQEPAVAGTTVLDLPAVSGTVITTGSSAVVTQAMLGTNVAGNGPAFSVYKDNGNQTVTGSTFTKITFNVELFDTNNNFASSTFTPTVAGYYHITGSYSVETVGTVSRFLTSIYKNGVEVNRNDLVATGNQAPVSAIVFCNGTTDYIELYCNIIGTGTLGVRGSADGAVYTYLQGCLLRTS
jgi:hypothetical protein